ncbi:MAG: tRNA (N6-isopentenyl adenosine(37)-C2)-methylthiotransferase MiaB, partial [Endomicrobiales bacterium]
YLGRLKPLKEKNPGLKVIVAGCAAQRLGEKLIKKFPLIDLVVGAKDIDRFSEWCDSVFGCSGEGDAGDLPRPARSAVSSFVTIMRGCDNFCSYCIVPHMRGRESSRSVEDILAEVRARAKDGVREVTLLGQNVNSYAGAFSNGSRADFAGLLNAVSAVEGIERVRFTTNHPKYLSDALIRTIAGTGKICKHVHLPLQSGSDRVLQAMNRGYTVADYSRLARKLRDAVPGISLTTDIMVGFPGETEEDFRETMRLVEKNEFNSLFAYKYSPREGTASFALKDDVPPEAKEKRLSELLTLANTISARKNARLIDTVQEVLIEKREERFCTARTDVNTKTYFYTDDPLHVPGNFVRVKVKECRITTLVGVIGEQVHLPGDTRAGG